MSAGRPGRERYWLYLIPGALLFVAVIVVPFVMNVGDELHPLVGRGIPKWTGLDNYVRLLRTSGSGRRSGTTWR